MTNQVQAKTLIPCLRKLTKKRTAYVRCMAEGESMSSFGTWWDGGSRTEFWLVNLATGQVTRPNYPTSPMAPTVNLRPEPGFALVEGGTFCGKTASIHVYYLPGDKVTTTPTREEEIKAMAEGRMMCQTPDDDNAVLAYNAK